MPGTFSVIHPPEPAASESAALEPAAAPPSVRPAWRRWLIDVERGLTHGVRGDSIFLCTSFSQVPRLPRRWS